MTAKDWIWSILLGGILVLVGQGIRVVAGLKKVNDQTNQEKGFSTLFQLDRLLLSLLIGFIAGALAAIPISAQNVDRQAVMTLIGAGYAGTDFIEAFMRKNQPKATG